MNGAVATAESTTLAKPPVLRITPTSRWWVLPFGELWEYRELLYFFVWRDIKVRYKQTAIGAAWAVLQPFLTMRLSSASFFEGSRTFLPRDCLTRFSITARCFPGCTSPARCRIPPPPSSKTSGSSQKCISPLGAAAFVRAVRPRGFRRLVLNVHRDDVLLPEFIWVGPC